MVSFDEKVCVPKLVGPGALASTLNNPDGGNKAKRLTVTFNCVGFGGTALVMVTVPVYGQRSGTVSFSVLKQCAAVNATEFGGEEADNPEMANELENVISHAGAGLHVGRSESGDGARDVIDNGLVLPEFLPTSNVENRDAGGYQVPLDQKSLTLYLSSTKDLSDEVLAEQVYPWSTAGSFAFLLPFVGGLRHRGHHRAQQAKSPTAEWPFCKRQS